MRVSTSLKSILLRYRAKDSFRPQFVSQDHKRFRYLSILILRHRVSWITGRYHCV